MLPIFLIQRLKDFERPNDKAQNCREADLQYDFHYLMRCLFRSPQDKKAKCHNKHKSTS